MHKFAALLTHGLLMTIEILHLNLLVILVHQNLGCGFILLTILILLSFFNRLNLKQKSFKNKPIPNYDKKIEKLENKPRLWWNFHGIFFLCILDFMFFCFSMFYLRATLCFADKFGLVYTIKIIQTYEWFIYIYIF